jgi:hypothetical protein
MKYNSDALKIITNKIGFSGSNNPFANIYFYDTKNIDNSFILNEEDISGLLCKKYSETKMLLICKDREIFADVKSKWDAYYQ